MDNKIKREIKDLQRQKAKKITQKDFVEAAKLSNLIGEILKENGLHEDAIKEHQDEERLSKATSDHIGEAIANRKIGECLCELGDFKQALKHQKIHLRISTERNDVTEQQRALATIGRTYFVQAESCKISGGKQLDVDKSSQRALDAYYKALECAEKLYGRITDHDVLEMKARLYLNIGLVHDLKRNLAEATSWLRKSIVISKEEQLDDNCYRCHYTMAEWLMSDDEHLSDALQNCRAADAIARKMGKKTLENDIFVLMGKIHLRSGDFENALQIFKKLYKHTSTRTREVIACIKRALKAMWLTDKYKETKQPEERVKICEELADLFVKLNSRKAVSYYLEQLKIATSLNNIDDKQIATIYTSIAVTYTEMNEYEKALHYYNLELKLRKEDWKEKSATYCAAANALEHISSPFNTVKEYYMKAIECAEKSKSSSALIKAYRDWESYLSTLPDKFLQCEQVNRKLQTLLKDYDSTCESQDVEDNDDDGGDECQSQELNDEELLAIQNDSEDEEEQLCWQTTSAGKRKTGKTKTKVNQKNNKGETPLHVAAIAGNEERVKLLLQQGASTNSHDYCGWSPLHEACNHGYTGIVRLLIEHSANVNDSGGDHACGITPLHDAGANGHVECVKLLLQAGASLDVKTKQGETPLDYVKKAVKANEEEFRESGHHQVLLQKLRNVKQCFSEWKKTGQHNKQLPVKDRRTDADIFNDLASSSASSASSDSEGDHVATLPPLKKQRTDDGVLLSKQKTLRGLRSPTRGDNVPLSPLVGEHDIPSYVQTCDSTSPLIPLDDFENEPELEMLDWDRMDGESSDSSQSPPIISVHGRNAFDLPSNNARVAPARNRTPTSPMKRRDSLGHVSKEKRHKQSTQKRSNNEPMQSLITFTRTPSPSPLLHEDDVMVDDIIIDDMKSKKKKTKSKPNQSRLPFEKVDANDIEVTSISLASTFSKRSVVASTQKRKRSNLNSNKRNENTLLTSQQPMTTTARTDVYRIKVRVVSTDTLYLIVCKPPDELNIGWLVDETRNRHCQTGSTSSPSVTLKTTDGALLNPADTISDVLQNNDEVLADITEQLQNTGQDRRLHEQARLSELELGLNNIFQDLTIQDKYLSKDHLTTLCKCVAQHQNLTTIKLCASFIGDTGFATLNESITKLAYLSTLHLNCIGITSKSLKTFQRSLIDDTSKKRQVCATLRDLSFSHNNFRNTVMFISSMAKIVKHCTSLENLSLRSCRLSEDVFRTNAFTDALTECSLKSLNVSRNNLVTENDVMQTVTSLNHTSLTSLDISGIKAPISDGILTDLTNLFVSKNSVLEKLSMKDTNFSTHSDILQPLNLDSSLRCLHFSKLTLSSEQVTNFMSSLMSLKHLEELEISSCSSFTGNVFNNISKQLITKLKRFIARSCTISEVSEQTTRYLASSSCRLKHLDLSYNELTDVDVDVLFKSWQARHRNDALCEKENVKFILFI